MKLLVALLLLIPTLTACDVMKERMGIPIAAKVEAEGKAIGSACRHAGRGLEDCFKMNPKADKAAVFAGWKEMNEYMAKNNMQSVTPEFPAGLPGKSAKGKTDDETGKAEAKHGEAETTATEKEKPTKKTEASDKEKPAKKDEAGDKAKH
jgi:hypothetical protein